MAKEIIYQSSRLDWPRACFPKSCFKSVEEVCADKVSNSRQRSVEAADAECSREQGAEAGVLSASQCRQDSCVEAVWNRICWEHRRSLVLLSSLEDTQLRLNEFQARVLHGFTKTIVSNILENTLQSKLWVLERRFARQSGFRTNEQRKLSSQHDERAHLKDVWINFDDLLKNATTLNFRVNSVHAKSTNSILNFREVHRLDFRISNKNRQ